MLGRCAVWLAAWMVIAIGVMDLFQARGVLFELAGEHLYEMSVRQIARR
ncbi:MAG: hypothetical protein J0H49_00530 [Acidobacteria bacterium]|nr:hypothetical protein [Acidobacteriota bacterium]